MSEVPGHEAAGEQSVTPAPSPESITPEPTLDEDLGVPDPDTNGHAPTSMLDRLREQYASVSEDDRKVIPIAPGRFGGNLAVRYRRGLIPYTDLRKRARKAARAGSGEENELNYAAGIISTACESVLTRVEDGGDLIPVDEAVEKWRGQPVRFDSRLCELLGIETTTASGTTIARLVFRNPAALNEHFAQLEAWITEAAEGDDDEDELTERPT